MLRLVGRGIRDNPELPAQAAEHVHIARAAYMLTVGRPELVAASDRERSRGR